MQPCHGAPPHQSAGSSNFWPQYSGTPYAASLQFHGHAQPCQQVPVQFMGTAYGPPHVQPWTNPMLFQGCSGRHPAAKPEQKRELNTAYCLIDEDGNDKPFSSISQISGRSHENMVSKIFDSGGPWTLRAVGHQNTQERERLEKSRNAVALLLQKTVSDHAGNAMMKKGVAEELAEVDTVFIGCFEDFAKRTSTFCNATVSATCAEVQHVLVEICSDSRFVAMKLYQIELQSCLVARQGYFSDEANPLSRQTLIAQTTGFAIIFNRIALRMKTEELAKEFGLKNVCQLLQEGKLHIAHFQPEAALPGALSMARDADQKAREASQKVRELEDKLQGDGPFSVSSLCFSDCFVGMSFKCIFFSQQNLEYMQHSISWIE